MQDSASFGLTTLSLPDALPILVGGLVMPTVIARAAARSRSGTRTRRCPARTTTAAGIGGFALDRKSTRLNSSHVSISYAVFCLKKKNATPPVVIDSANAVRETV